MDKTPRVVSDLSALDKLVLLYGASQAAAASKGVSELNERMDALQAEMRRANDMNRLVLAQQILELKRKERQKQLKDFLFALKKAKASVDSVADSAVKAFLIDSVLVPGREWVASSVVELDELRDKEFADELSRAIGEAIERRTAEGANVQLFQRFDEETASYSVLLRDGEATDASHIEMAAGVSVKEAPWRSANIRRAGRNIGLGLLFLPASFGVSVLLGALMSLVDVIAGREGRLADSSMGYCVGGAIAITSVAWFRISQRLTKQDRAIAAREKMEREARYMAAGENARKDRQRRLESHPIHRTYSQIISQHPTFFSALDACLEVLGRLRAAQQGEAGSKEA